MLKYCSNCGKELNGSSVCPNCGISVSNSIKSDNQNDTEKSNGFAIAGFILSLLSFFCCGSTSVLGLVFSIIGLVNHKKYNSVGKGLAIAGIVISSFGILLIVMLNLLVFVGGYTFDSISTYYY